jgi:hypothetical protein
MIKELTKYIENNTSFVIDEDLFAGFRPVDSQDRCVAVLEPTGGMVNSYFPDSGDKMIQILSRAQSYWDARDDIYTVFDLLKSKAQVTFPTLISDTTYKAEFIEAQQFPQSVGQDEEGRWEFSANLLIRIRKM